MSRFVTGNLMLLGSMACGATSHVLIKALLNGLRQPAVELATLDGWLQPDRVVKGSSAVVLLVGGFLLWVLALARLDLSYAYPVACSSLLLVSLLSAIFLGETLSLRTFAGTVLILAGLILLAPRTL